MILRRDHPGLLRWALNSMTSVLKRDRTEDTHTEKKRGHMKMKAEIRVMKHKLRNFRSHQKLELASKDSPLEPSEAVP